MTQLQLAKFEKWWSENHFLDADMSHYVNKDRAKELYELALAPEIEWHPASETPTNGTYLVTIKGTKDVEYRTIAITTYTGAWTVHAGESVVLWANCPKIPGEAL